MSLCMSAGLSLLAQVAYKQLLQQLVAVEAADKCARVVVVCDIRRVLADDVTNQLIYRVIALTLRASYTADNISRVSAALIYCVNLLVTSSMA